MSDERCGRRMPDGDWPEDVGKDVGGNDCDDCGCVFIGVEGRSRCKRCASRIATRDRARDAVNDAVARVVARIEMYDESEAASGTGAMHLDALIKHCRALKRAVDAYTAVILPSASRGEKP